MSDDEDLYRPWREPLGVPADEPPLGAGRVHEFEGRLVTRQELRQELEDRFRPLRPANTARLILAGIFGPLLWVLCILFAVFLVQPTQEIVFGAIVTALSFVAAGIILLLVHRARRREEREFVDRL